MNVQRVFSVSIALSSVIATTATARDLGAYAKAAKYAISAYVIVTNGKDYVAGVIDRENSDSASKGDMAKAGLTAVSEIGKYAQFTPGISALIDMNKEGLAQYVRLGNFDDQYKLAFSQNPDATSKLQQLEAKNLAWRPAAAETYTSKISELFSFDPSPETKKRMLALYDKVVGFDETTTRLKAESDAAYKTALAYKASVSNNIPKDVATQQASKEPPLTVKLDGQTPQTGWLIVYDSWGEVKSVENEQCSLLPFTKDTMADYFIKEAIKNGDGTCSLMEKNVEEVDAISFTTRCRNDYVHEVYHNEHTTITTIGTEQIKYKMDYIYDGLEPVTAETVYESCTPE